MAPDYHEGNRSAMADDPKDDTLEHSDDPRNQPVPPEGEAPGEFTGGFENMPGSQEPPPPPASKA